jgi:hypothetical protein
MALAAAQERRLSAVDRLKDTYWTGSVRERPHPVYIRQLLPGQQRLRSITSLRGTNVLFFSTIFSKPVGCLRCEDRGVFC